VTWCKNELAAVYEYVYSSLPDIELKRKISLTIEIKEFAFHLPLQLRFDHFIAF